MLNMVLPNMKVYGRIALCGMISQYLSDHHEGATNMISALFKRVRIEGFAVFDYFHQYSEFLEVVLPLIKEGKVVYVEDIIEGLENAPKALVGLYEGLNVGKQVVAVAAE